MIALVVACVPGAVLRDLEVEAGGAGETNVRLTGAELSFERFVLTVEDLRLHEARVTARLGPPLPWLLTPTVAGAHPGHEGAGDVRGELLGRFPLDLLGLPIALGSAQVYSGSIASLSLGVGEARIEGSLRREGQQWPVAFHLDLGGERVEGIPVSLELAAEGAAPTLVLRGDVAAFADAALLGQASDTDGDGMIGLADGTLENSLAFGLRSTTIWTAQAVQGE